MKMKRILAAAMCLCVAATANIALIPEQTLTVQALTAPAPSQYEDLLYVTYDDHVEIVSYTGTSEEVIVPDEIEGLPVTVIDQHAFANKDVTSVTLPETLTSIMLQAFWGCTKLTSVNIPKGVTRIYQETFSNCSSLESIELPEGLLSIGERAFYHCSLLTSVDIPDGVTVIGTSAFDNCSGLTSVYLPESRTGGITEIEDGVFFGTALKELYVPYNVTSIGLWSLPSSLERLTVRNSECLFKVETVPTLSSSCVIAGEMGSNAQEFAETYGYTFEPVEFPDVGEPPYVEPPTGQILGDVSGDFDLTVIDAVMLQKWLLGIGELATPGNGDMNKDGVIDIFDLALLKRKLLSETPAPLYTAVNISQSVKSQEVTGAEADDTFIMGQTAFALSLLQNSVEENENILVSPYSVVQALAMTANGADGQTRTEMESVLGGSPMEELNAYLYTQRIHQPNTENCKLTTANSIWYRDTEELEVKKDFLQTNADYYGADAFKAPFDNSTVTDINNWVNTNTDGMIPSLLQDGEPINSNVILMDAVAFDAKWASPYLYEHQLWDWEFTASDGTVQTAEMLFSDEYHYLEDAHATGFLKYYKDGRYAFAALLPDEGMSVTEYIASLTPESLHETLANPEETAVDAGLPKFSYDYDTMLNDAFSAMGMSSAFSAAADFSRMTDQKLYIDKVIHKTHIDVFEDGTKAAALTAFLAPPAEAAPDPDQEKPKEVILDRPFVYCIVDTETALPVFIGALMEIPE